MAPLLNPTIECLIVDKGPKPTFVAVDKIASRANILPTNPPTLARREVRGCPPPGTGPCPYAHVSVCVP